MVDKIITVSNNIINWDELVGYEAQLKDYKIIIVGYNKQKYLLSISEIRPDLVITNELCMYDGEKSVEILKQFGLNISIVHKFKFSETTFQKINGLFQAGFSFMDYNIEEDRILVDSKFEMNELITDKEKAYLYSRVKLSDNNIIYFKDILG